MWYRMYSMNPVSRIPHGIHTYRKLAVTSGLYFWLTIDYHLSICRDAGSTWAVFKTPCWLMIIGAYTTQYLGDYLQLSSTMAIPISHYTGIIPDGGGTLSWTKGWNWFGTISSTLLEWRHHADAPGLVQPSDRLMTLFNARGLALALDDCNHIISIYQI